jgi:hypothetical protein
MSDLLSAASLLLAVIAVLYGLWYPELTKALEAPVAHFPEDRTDSRALVTTALSAKSRPLVAASTAMALVFLPDAIRVALNAMRTVARLGFGAVPFYNAVQTSFALVELVLIGLAIHLIRTHLCLRTLLKKLSSA